MVHSIKHVAGVCTYQTANNQLPKKQSYRDFVIT